MEFITKILQAEAPSAPLEHVQGLASMVLVQCMGKAPSKFPIPSRTCG